MIKAFASVIVSAATLTALGTIVAPEATAHALERVPAFIEEMTQPDCDTQPRECLKRKGEKLEALEDDLDMSAGETLESTKRLRQQNAVFAAEMKRIF